MSAEVTLVPAAATDVGLLANLIELYVHDLSETFQIAPGEDGRFGYERLPLYFSEPARRLPFLIRSGGRIAGFTFVTRGSPMSDDPDVLDVAEFFVLRGYRRFGIGRSAAFLLWNRLPGSWVVRVSEGNRAGVPFWDAIIREHTNGAYTAAQRPGSPHPWRVFTFKS
ncbi:MAG TPA: GNAT family N-acetyltransferase [Myxococcota bacterium]|nr:GNAT family N-acetyltransferase [Myxococcota bacterium]